MYDLQSISLLFNISCIALHNLTDIFNHSKSIKHDQFYMVHLELSDLPNYLSQFKQNLSYFYDCLDHMDHQLLLETQNNCSSCSSELCNPIFNNGTLEPYAWQLDMMDQENDVIYKYCVPSNISTDLWILDTGTNPYHIEFNPGQVIETDPSFTFINMTSPHGTGTAGCAGSIHYGTSKNLTIYSYPVCRMGGSCASYDIDKGLMMVLNWLQKHNGTRRAVINLSLGSYVPSIQGSSYGAYYNSIFKSITDAGGIVVVAAGNSNQDACNWLFSFSPYVISVGAIDNQFNKASFSNWGDCVDIWSFGVSVITPYANLNINDNTTCRSVSGTSFSSPTVAGLIANILNLNPTYKKEDILNILNSYNFQSNLTVAKYICGQENLKCCKSNTTYITRRDIACRSYNITGCPSYCMISAC